MRSSVISDFAPVRVTSTRIVRMLSSSTLCRNGSARVPPASTIFCPPKPVRISATSRDVLR
jgi:hypothetical protein